MPLSATDRIRRVQQFIPPSPTSAYKVRISGTDLDVAGAQRLRYKVFNVELGEGLKESEATGKDEDPFDAVCDHLLIEHVTSGEIIGTYRLQTGRSAGDHIGYYSEQEFDFAPFEPIRSELVELGRACIAKEHRNMVVLGLLWKGIAQYAKIFGARYLVGCSSITSTDPVVGQAAFCKLSRYLAEAKFLTRATQRYRCDVEPEREYEVIELSRSVDIPRLMRAYLTLGARICGEPALDRDFKTIDFLTLIDLRSMGPRAMAKFLG
ncbi:GNAT family N-acetyltransferase [Pelagicoccus albus]|uniref:GNAT family N-acetyltransferase n=1 Tax=Pelagicoccus albus TaxID=415222 RepID=A0A7X1E732_9BACT|nr:GNAT family N-acyltransferase [Pelagicoccus albus]MBC2604909.1 GNAT family N-acetyltransferase [Pelagicoccus albus]